MTSILNSEYRRAGLAAIALLLAGFIYAALRPSPRALLEWASWIGLRGRLWALQEDCAPLRHSLPPFAIYSLPDGLWLLSLLAALDVVWSRYAARGAILWSVSAAAVGLEFAQSVWPRLGTFDWMDLVALICGAMYCASGPLGRPQADRRQMERLCDEEDQI